MSMIGATATTTTSSVLHTEQIGFVDIDAWFYAKQAEWDAIDPETLFPATRRAFTQAKTGFWKTYNGYDVYNILASREVIDYLLDILGDVHAVYTWVQGKEVDKFNEDGTFNTLPADILAVQKDHVTYDENGDVIDTTPASYENPKWGHVFYGQGRRIFAGSFTDDFDEGFK